MEVRIYGLPRSGTNFLEYLIRNNTDCIYEYDYKKGDEYLGWSSEIAIKHCCPNDDDNLDIYLIIVKNKSSFIESYKKWDKYNYSHRDISNMYEKAIDDYIKFKQDYPSKVEIIPYEKLVGNEAKYLKILSYKFGFNINDKIDIPKKKMSRDGGISLTKKVFDRRKIINNKLDTNSKIYRHLLIL